MKNRIALLSLFFAACTNVEKAQSQLELPSKITESSALEMIAGHLYTLEDHGNANVIYRLSENGKLQDKIQIDLPNNDWESLASDADGNLYIGDFGNNDNDRKDLVIYKIAAGDLDKKTASVQASTQFYYPQQKEFPAKKKDRNFDCEAFFESDGNFYLFTKNRSSNFDGTLSVYKIPNQPGKFAAEKIGEFKTCDKFKSCAVTAADISPDGKKVALLTAGAVYLFEDFESDDFTNGKLKTIPIEDFSQKEGLCFASNTKIYLSDEKDKKTGGKIYAIDLSESKP